MSGFGMPTHTGWFVRKVKNLARVSGAVLAAVLLICLPVFSQGSQGTIQGAVLDQSGGAIAGATVTITDLARGASRPLTTDASGAYIATNLIPGMYSVKAVAPGFQTVEHSNVQVEVGQNVRVDLTLQPGAQTQTITVTSEAPAIDTTDATLGGAVSNQSINSLPLNGRNYERLLQLRPGVVTTIGGGTGSASTNGRRTGNDLFLVEGLAQISPSTGASTLNSSYRSGESASLISIDAIQEFATQQNPKAEYGWRDGSVVNVGIKSGTNAIHGSAYAFGRDESFDAANSFTPGQRTPIALEQFGATAGGRIIKDKLFWFVGYEGLRSVLGSPVVATIPSDVTMGGDKTHSLFDACVAVTPAKVNPLSAQLLGLTAVGSGSCVISPASATVENLFPYNPTTSNNFSPNLTTLQPLNNGFIKGDYLISAKQHVSGMYYASEATQLVQYSSSGGIFELFPQWEATLPNKVRMYNGTWTWTPTSNWVNEFRGGYSNLHSATLANDANKIPSAAYPAGYSMPTGVSNPLYGGLPEIDFNGFTGYLGAGKRTSIRGPEGDADFVDNVSYLRGKHAFKFGFEYMDTVFDGDTYNQANGQIKFKSKGANTTLMQFLLGSPNSGTILIGDPSVNVRARNFAGFAQDDWRLTTKVTVNLGLRYEYNGAPYERNNYLGIFDPSVNSATTSAVQQVGPGAPIHSLYTPNKDGFSPRVGVAWDVKGNGKTVVRAAGSLMNVMEIAGDLVDFAPFGANIPDIDIKTNGTAANLHTPDQISVSSSQFAWNTTGPIFPIGSTSGVFVNGVGPYTGVTCTAYTDTIGTTALNGAPNSGVPCATVTVAPNFHTPFTVEWNLDVQRAITNNLTIDVAYVGNHGYDEPSRIDLNQPAYGAGWDAKAVGTCLASAPTYANCNPDTGIGGPGTGAEAGPYSAKFPYLNYIDQQGNLDFSNYNALQVTLNLRPTHGLSFLAGYTYSHALDVLSGNIVGQAASPIDGHNVRLSYGTGNNDIRNRFTFSPTYNLPGKKFPGQMLEGWSVSSIITLQGGLPWYPVDTTNDISGTGEFNNSLVAPVTTWNYSGPTSAFKSGVAPIPCFGNISGCSPVIPQACITAATAPYSGNAQLMGLALASLNNLGCYAQGGGVLTPPAYGQVGDASRNLFRSPAYYNVDFVVAKDWKIKERYGIQFRAEFFNLFNRADLTTPSTIDPNKGINAAAGTGFGCSCATPDVSGANPVLGSGGARAIQFGTKLTF